MTLTGWRMLCEVRNMEGEDKQSGNFALIHGLTDHRVMRMKRSWGKESEKRERRERRDVGRGRKKEKVSQVGLCTDDGRWQTTSGPDSRTGEEGHSWKDAMGSSSSFLMFKEVSLTGQQNSEDRA